MPAPTDVLHAPHTLRHWQVLGTVLQAAVGATFGMVVGQAVELWAGGLPRPPGAYAWGGAAAGAIIGGLTHHQVSQAKRRHQR